MLLRLPACLLLSALLLPATDKRLPIDKTSNDVVEISGTLYLDKQEIRGLLGYDPPDGLVVVKTEVRPVSDHPVRIDYDDFYLLSDKDGQRAAPYEPSQIAGDDTLIVKSTGAAPGGFGKTRPTFGVGGMYGGMGSGGPAPTQAEAQVSKAEPGKENPLLAVLKAKKLPEIETGETVSGLLYFQMEGKLKPKDLELHYKSTNGKLAFRFHP